MSLHYVLNLGNYAQQYYYGANLNINNGKWDYVIALIFNALEYIRAYIDDLLIISNSSFEDHLNNIKIVLKKLKAAGFKINAEKFKFARDSLEYLGFLITRQDIMPLPNKVQAIKHIAVPTYKKQLRSFIGGE